MGGCVRDLLLGVKPKDFDVATDARPDRIMDLFPQLRPRGRPLRRGAGARCVFAGGSRHLPQRPRLHRRPPARQRALRDAIPQQDVLRRDFTINGLMMDPETGGRAGLTSAGGPTWRAASCAPSAIPRRASAKTTCGCCAPSASPRAWDFEIEPATFAGDATRTMR